MPLKLDQKSLWRHKYQPGPVKIDGHESKWTLQSDENDESAKVNGDFELKRFDTW